MQALANNALITQDVQLAKVTSVNDTEGLNRVEVELLSHSGSPQQVGVLWARVATPCAGSGKGAFFIPDVDDEVLVTFINGDSRYPVVIGSLWNGSDAAPEQLGGSGESVDRWTIVGKNGSRIAIVEENPGSETISFTTPAGTSGELTDMGGGKIELTAAGSTVTIDPSGVSIDTPGVFKVQASLIDMTAGSVNVSAGMSMFSGVVQSQSVITTSVVSASYTPGAGNIW